METRANYVIVGIFTIVAIAAAFFFVYWTAGLGQRGETAMLRVRIPGSASGLGRGSAVLFNGVKVGEVQRVYLDLSNPKVAIADAVVDRMTPITPSTKADIGLAGLTGTANVELNGGNPREPNILDAAEQENRTAEITANPSAVTNLLQTAQSILTRADTVVSQLEGFVGDARAPLTQTLKNVEAFSGALGRNADNIDKFLDSVGKLSTALSNTAGQLDETLKSAKGLLDSVDHDQIRQTVANIQDFTKRLDSASQNLTGLMTNLDTTVASIGVTAKSVGTFSDNARKTLSKVDGILDGVDPAALRTALTNFEQASVTVNKAVNDVAKVTEKVGDHSEDIDTFIENATQLSQKLNQASVRVDGILAKVDALLSSDKTDGLVAEARETLKAFRQVATTLNARLDTITANLAHFTGPGLRDVEALVRDSRRSISRIERAVTDLERNPQRIITGGEGEVPRYNGRARH